MGCLAPPLPNILWRCMCLLAADARSPLDRAERTALLAWLYGMRTNVVILLPDDLLPTLGPYIKDAHPELCDELSVYLAARGIPPLGLEAGLAYPRVCLDSPLEMDFFLTWHEQALDLLYPLTPQYPIKEGRYRLDFAFPPLQVGIELDGYTYHSDREAFTRDRQRQREIEAQGWRVIRFSGDELRQDIVRCVQEAAHFLSIAHYRKES